MYLIATLQCVRVQEKSKLYQETDMKKLRLSRGMWEILFLILNIVVSDCPPSQKDIQSNYVGPEPSGYQGLGT